MFRPQHGHPVLTGGKDVPSPLAAAEIAAPLPADSQSEHSFLSAAQIELRQDLIFEWQLLAICTTAQHSALRQFPPGGVREVCYNLGEIFQHALKFDRDGSGTIEPRCETENRLRDMPIRVHADGLRQKLGRKLQSWGLLAYHDKSAAAAARSEIAQATITHLDKLGMLMNLGKPTPAQVIERYREWIGAAAVLRIEGELNYAAPAAAQSLPAKQAVEQAARPVADPAIAIAKAINRHARKYAA